MSTTHLLFFFWQGASVISGVEEASLSFDVGQAITASAEATAEGALSMPINPSLSYDKERIVERALSFGVIPVLTSIADATAEGSIAFAADLTLSIDLQADISDTISMGFTPAMAIVSAVPGSSVWTEQDDNDSTWSLQADNTSIWTEQ